MREQSCCSPVYIAVQPRHVAGAVSWGAFFSLAPIHEFIETGAIVWVPVLLFFEWRRTKQFGLLPGTPIRVLIVATMVWAATHAPLKYLDRTVGPFSPSTVGIGELDAALRAHRVFTETHPHDHDALVTLPARSVSLRELFESIETQTGLHYQVGYCGTGETLLFGMHPIFVTLAAPDVWGSGAARAP